MRIARKLLILVAGLCIAGSVEAQERGSEVDAAAAAIAHVRQMLPFADITLHTSRAAEGGRNTSFIEALGKSLDIPMAQSSEPRVVCEDRCRQIERRSLVQVGLHRATADAVTVTVSWLVPVERGDTLFVRSGNTAEMDLARTDGRWEVVRMGDLRHYTITEDGSER